MGATILVVTSAPPIGKNACFAAGRVPASAQWVQSCAEARERLDAEHFDLVYVDLGEPGAEQLITTIRERPELADLPIIAHIYGEPGPLEAEQRRAHELGADASFSIPFQAKDLIAEVRRLLAERGRPV